MEYGIRRYEASQRLWWFAFFLLSLLGGFPASNRLQSWFGRSLADGSLKPKDALQGADFWLSTPWASQGLLGSLIFYLAGVLLACLILRTVWLGLQIAGTFVVARALKRHLSAVPKGPMPGRPEWLTDNPTTALPGERLAREASQLPWSFFSLAHKRLRLLVSDGRGIPSSDEMVQREQRLEGVDWQLVGSSWNAFRSLSRALPLLGFVQSAWVFYLWFQPILDGTQDVGSSAVAGVACLLALVQTLGAALAFGIGSGFLSRLENLYLSRLDGLFYDQLLARVPLHNADTLLILKTLANHFRDIQERLKRLEQAVTRERS